jgi:cytochrome c-type biogenesis protein CcmE
MKKKASGWMMTILVIVVGLVLIVTGLMRTNLNYYMTISEVKKTQPESRRATVRVLGIISPGTWKSDSTLGTYRFILDDGGQTLPVRYTGSPIDSTPERQIIVEGNLAEDGTFISCRIMTKCESKYSAKSMEGR